MHNENRNKIKYIKIKATFCITGAASYDCRKSTSVFVLTHLPEVRDK